MTGSYAFTPVSRADYPRLRAWLAEPHVRAWWGTPDEELALIEQDLADAAVDMRIVSLNGQPFAYVQDYPAHHWPMPQYADQPAGARAMDTFLGDPALLGQGHGARYLKARARALMAQGCPRVVMDPDPANHRAVKTYRRAGFRGATIRPCEDGDPVLVMEFDPAAPADTNHAGTNHAGRVQARHLPPSPPQ